MTPSFSKLPSPYGHIAHFSVLKLCRKTGWHIALWKEKIFARQIRGLISIFCVHIFLTFVDSIYGTFITQLELTHLRMLQKGVFTFIARHSYNLIQSLLTMHLIFHVSLKMYIIFYVSMKKTSYILGFVANTPYISCFVENTSYISCFVENISSISCFVDNTSNISCFVENTSYVLFQKIYSLKWYLHLITYLFYSYLIVCIVLLKILKIIAEHLRLMVKICYSVCYMN